MRANTCGKNYKQFQKRAMHRNIGSIVVKKSNSKEKYARIECNMRFLSNV